MNKQDSFRERAKIMALVLAALVAVHMANLLLGGYFLYFGIQPRDIGSIYTIGTAPFIHGDFAHLGNNMIGIAIFGFLCLLRGVRYFLEASAIIIVLTGLLVWLFGREATHIGASGWLFGLWSMAIALAWFERSFISIAVAMAVVFFYGGMVFGVLPTQPYISFESHLFGAISGVVAAGWLHRHDRRRGVRDGW